MKFNKWTLGLAAVGVVSLTSAARADETNMLMTALSTTTISGYVDVSAQFNPNGGGGAPNYYYGQPANSVNLNVVDVTIEKALDESPWASGYHVELFVGPLAQNIGLNNDIRQAYITLRTPVGNGIDWKIGIFDTIVGYESTTSANNPNYSHSYGYNMEPTTHTGVLANYKAADWISMQVGVANESYNGGGGYNVGTPSAGMYHPTFMWGPTLTAPDSFGWAKGATLSVATILTGGNTAGNYSNSGGSGKNIYAGITLPTPLAALTTGASFDYLNAADVAGNAWDIAAYGSYKFNDKLSLNVRAEYYNGAPLNNGAGYGYNEGWTGVNSPNPYGSQQEAQEITTTVQYNLWANVLTRLEFRWDHVNHGNGYDNNNESGYRQNAFMLGAQAIYTF